MRREELTRECGVFTRHLLGKSPSPYIVDRYCDYHAVSPAMNSGEDAFDRVLTRFASRNAICAKVADAYASRFHRNSTLRRKLVLLLALSEVTPPFFHGIDHSDRLSRPALLTKLAVQGATFAAALGAGILLLGPLHVLEANSRRRRENIR
jgi:hypothetical protein